MLFASQDISYGCRGCGLEVWKSTPASPIFLFALGVFGLAFMVPFCLNQGWELSGQLYGVGFVLFAGLGLGLTCLVDSAFNRLKPLPDACFTCGKELEIPGGRFSHSFFPSIVEFIVIVIFFAAFFGVRVWLESAF